MFNLKGKTAFITGVGNNLGMGVSHAFSLIEHGANVVITGKNEKFLNETVEEILKNGGSALGLYLDVNDQKNIDDVFSKAVNYFGSIDILVNNAGHVSLKPSLDLTREEWEQMLDVNLKAQFFCAQAAAKYMAKKKWGRIINIGSISSGQIGVGLVGGAHYSAAKGGVIGMTEALAAEWAPLNITVNVICPGSISTSMIMDNPQLENWRKERLERIPLKRFGQPKEVSSAVIFLSSEEAGYITGSAIVIDGGFLSA